MIAKPRAEHPTTGRPWALTALWIILMAPLSLAGTVLQPHVPVSYDVFPLVMLGPAIAAGICRLTVARWYPPALPVATGATWRRSLIAAGCTSVMIVVVIVPFGAGRSAIIPHGVSAMLAVPAVIVGLFLGSWCEEIGYRGVMYRAVSARLTTLPAIIVNGVFFGLCHLQYFGAGLLPVLLFVLATVFLDACMVLVWTGNWRQRVIVATIVHATVNIGLQLAGISSDRLLDFAGLTLALAAATIVAGILGRWFGLGDRWGKPVDAVGATIT